MPFSLDRIIDLLAEHHQRATYGAVAALVGRTPQNVLAGRKRDRRHSWVVNQQTGRPTGYHELLIHPALHEREAVLTTADELRAWLADPR